MINSTLSAGSEAKAKVSAQLTHLDFLPVTPEKGDGSLPTIQAIFSTPPDIVAVNQSQPQQPPFSIVTRYEVHQVQQNQLHSSLDQVTSKKKSVGSVPARAVWVLKKQTDTMMHSVVLTFSPLWYHMILAFCYSDGTIEFRKRSTMARIDPDYSSEMVTSMTQAGFAFTNVETSLHIALSPNHCMAACMQQDGTIKTRSMEYTYGSLAGDDDEPRQSAALAALVLQSMSAANQYFCSDDIIAVMGELSEARKTQFFSLMFEGLNINIDCCLDEQNSLILLGRAPMFIKTLSAMHVMGLKGRLNRSLTSKTAWAVLNIKYVTQILTTIARMHQQLPDKNLRPEMTPLFINVCRWAMHFMNYLIDELVETGRSLQPLIAQSPNGLTHDLLQQHIHAINKPALLLVLSSFPRVMLKHWFMPIQWTHRTTANVLSGRSQHPPEVRRLYEPLSQAITEAPIKYDHFDDLIKEAQHLVSTIYKRHAGPGPVTPEAQHAQHEQRKLWERDLLLGRIPDALFPAAKRLVTDTIFGAPNDASTTQSQGQNQGPTCLLDKVDMAKIMFFDTTWLGLTASKRANSWFDTHVVDVCQKMIIRGTGAQSHPAPAGPPPTRNRSDSIQSANGAESKKKQLRKCLRCGAYMEDVLMGMPGYGAHHVNWLMGVAKHCICGNAWMLAPEKEGARADGGIFTKARKG
jgi:mediator of RNA polymerase II transcription subunit 16